MKGSFEKADIGLDKPNPRDSMVNARKADSTKVNKPAEKEKK